MNNHLLRIKTKSEYELETVLKSHLDEYGLESLKRAFARATSDVCDKKFQEDFNIEKLPDKDLNQFKADTQGTIKYDHARLFEKDEGGKMLVSQPCDISMDTLRSYMKFADDNKLRLKISKKYSTWYPGEALTVMFETR